MVNAGFTKAATAHPVPSPGGTRRWQNLTRFPCLQPSVPFAKGALLPPRGARHFGTGPVDLAVVAELVDAQR